MSQPTLADQPQDLPPVVPGGGFRIPLDPPTSLTKEDGSFDRDKILNHISWVARKYRRILTNIERNRGPEALEGAEIKDLADLDFRIQASVPLSYTKMWTVPIAIGSNNQPFAVDIDTGSADLWVPNSTAPSPGRKSYNASTSTTSKKEPGTFSIEYADDSTVSGPIYSDTVTIGSVKATGQHFSAATAISESYQAFPADGIIGLGFESESELKAPPFIQNAAALKQIPLPAFALKLTKTNASINLGGPDAKDYKGTIEYHNVSSTEDWVINGASVTVNGKIPASNFKTDIDSGTGMMIGPPDLVKVFYDAIPGSKVYDATKGLYSYPTKSPPSVSFSWGGKDWVVSPENFSLGTKGDQTIGALIGEDIGLDKGVWLLGSRFMQNVYSVFDFTGTARIGFAELA